MNQLLEMSIFICLILNQASRLPLEGWGRRGWQNNFKIANKYFKGGICTFWGIFLFFPREGGGSRSWGFEVPLLVHKHTNRQPSIYFLIKDINFDVFFSNLQYFDLLLLRLFVNYRSDRIRISQFWFCNNIFLAVYQADNFPIWNKMSLIILKIEW